MGIVRSTIEQMLVVPIQTPTGEMVADPLTKADAGTVYKRLARGPAHRARAHTSKGQSTARIQASTVQSMLARMPECAVVRTVTAKLRRMPVLRRVHVGVNCQPNYYYKT